MERNHEADGGNGGEVVRPVAVPRQPQALKTIYMYGDKATLSLPIILLGDSSREFMGFYCTLASGTVWLTPTVGGGLPRIELNSAQQFFEMRLSSHGPMIQDEWVVDSPGGGEVTIIIITKEGE